MFAHLAARTSFSLRNGVIRPHELAVAVAERGMDTIGVADRGGLYGVVRLAEACKVVGIKLVVGADLALDPDQARPGWEIKRAGRGMRGVAQRFVATDEGRPAWTTPGTTTNARAFAGPGSGAAWLEDDAARVTLIARTQPGYANLCRTVTDHHMESVRSDPHVTWEQLGRRPDGTFVMLGDGSPVGRLLDAGRSDAAEAEARRWMELVGPSSVLVGVTHHLAPATGNLPSDDERARARFDLADRLGLKAVANQVPRYLNREDARVADVMDAVRQQVPLDPRHSSRRNAEGYLKTPAQMARVFAERPDAIANAAWVAERCNVDLGLGRLRVPDFVALGSNAMTELRGRCEAGIRERYANPGNEHTDLLERELAMVDRLGLAPYFLTVADVVARIREKQILVACRGSAAGSIITYALRISDVDPVIHDLAFERFMNPYRDELPDIDIDVESARREDIYRDLLDRYGDDRVACVCMIETFKARMAIREVGKAIGMPPVEIDVLAKAFPHIRAGDVRPALEHLPELQGLNFDRPDLRLLFDVVERLDGFPRHVALHPSGVLLADATLRDVVPLERSAARGAGTGASPGFAMAQFDKDDVEALGLCKLDVLAVRMLSSMSHCVDEVRRVRGKDIDLGAIPYNDPDTYDVIRSTRTLGMFQIESPGQRELIGKFQPEHMDDLVVDISLFRPGPVKGDMIGPFLDRRLGRSHAVIPHPILERALGETYGVIVFHEQVMRCVAAMTGCDLSTADLVRRRLGDPEHLDELRDWVLAGAKKRGVPDDVAKSVWHALSQFASFGFCKAHAAAFAVPTFRSAWLKTHVLPEFVAGLLTHDPGMYPRRLLLEDARQFGVAVLPLDVNKSDRVYRAERLPADEAYALLGVPDGVGTKPASAPVSCGTPPGWRYRDGSWLPPAGFDKGADPDHPGWRFGIRLALQDVGGIDDRQIESLLVARPFTSVEDLRRRAALSQPVAEALAHAGAMDEIAGVSAGKRARREVLLEVVERWSGLRRHQPADPTAPQQLDLLPNSDPAGLTDYRRSERVRAELEVLGLDATDHVIRFYDGLLDQLGVTRASDLMQCRSNQRVRVAGVKVATQTPPVKSGQRVIFLSLDDATGISDATFFESVHDRCAWTVFHTWLLVVEGTVRRTGRRGISINAEVVWDLRRLMHAWQEGWLDEALIENREPARPALEVTNQTRPALEVTNQTRPALEAIDDDPVAPHENAPRVGNDYYGDGRSAEKRLRSAKGQPEPGQVNGKSLDGLRTHGREPASPTRAGPNGATWADPTGRNGNVEAQDLYRLPRSDPRHPRHVPAAENDDDTDRAEPPRKLWHSSGGSAGG